MLKKVLSAALLVSSLGTGLMAADDANHWMVRVGYIDATSGTYNVEDTNGYTTSDKDMTNSGFEISVLSGVDKGPGFDFRSGLTFQYSTGTLDGGYWSDVDETNMYVLGEFEFAYNVNEYISPIVGFNGGLGGSKYDDGDYQLGAELGAFIGVNGDFYGKFGYYLKYGYSLRKVFDTNDGDSITDADILTAELTPLTFGVSYTF